MGMDVEYCSTPLTLRKAFIMHVPQPFGRYTIGGLIGRREMGHEGVKYGRLNTPNHVFVATRCDWS